MSLATPSPLDCNGNRLKVGQRVKVVDFPQLDPRGVAFMGSTPNMRSLIGREVVILNMRHMSALSGWHVWLEGHAESWRSVWFAPLPGLRDIVQRYRNEQLSAV